MTPTKHRKLEKLVEAIEAARKIIAAEFDPKGVRKDKALWSALVDLEAASSSVGKLIKPRK